MTPAYFHQRINIPGPYKVTVKQGEFLYTGKFDSLFEALEWLEENKFHYYIIQEVTLID